MSPRYLYRGCSLDVVWMMVHTVEGMLTARKRIRHVERQGGAILSESRERLLCRPHSREVYRWGFQTVDLTQFWPQPGSPRERCTTTSGKQGGLGIRCRRRSHRRKSSRHVVCILSAEGRGPYRRFDRHPSAVLQLVPEILRSGCPLNNLAIEMSALDEGFRKRPLAMLFHEWQEGIFAAAFARGTEFTGRFASHAQPDETAGFLIAMYEGYVLLAKNARDPKVWEAGIRNIVGWLRSLRVPGNSMEADR